MKSLKTILCLILIFAMVLSLSACGKDKGYENTDKIVIGTTMAIEKAEKGEYNFDMISSGVSQPPLVSLDSNGEFSSVFATITSDGNVWKFVMNEGYSWSDGQALVVEDIEYAMTLEDSFKDLVESYSYEDDKTLLVTLVDTNVRFINNLTSLRLQPSHAKENGNDLWYGPYVFESFDKDAGTLTFVRNEGFKVDSAISTVVYQIYNSEEAMYMALTQGDIDTVWNYGSGVPGEYIDLIDKDNYTVNFFPATNLPAVLAFNCNSEKFSDENIRLAISFSLDYEQIVKYLGSDSSVVSKRGNVPDTTLGYYDGTDSYTKDDSLVESYMKNAGYSLVDGKYVNANNEQFEFTLSVNSAKAPNVKAAELVKTQLESAGMLVNIESLDSTAFNAKTSNKFSGNNISFEAAIQAYTSNGMAMGDGLGTIYVNGNHAVQGCCQVYDEAFIKALDGMSMAASIEEYVVACKDVQLYYAGHTPFISLYWDGFYFVRKNDVAKTTFLDQNFGINNFRNFVVLE